VRREVEQEVRVRESLLEADDFVGVAGTTGDVDRLLDAVAEFDARGVWGSTSQLVASG